MSMIAFALSCDCVYWANWSFATFRYPLGWFCLAWAVTAFIVAVWLLVPRVAGFMVHGLGEWFSLWPW
jgi:hypothetical protein